jgi:hypothetical protein
MVTAREYDDESVIVAADTENNCMMSNENA